MPQILPALALRRGDTNIGTLQGGRGVPAGSHMGDVDLRTIYPHCPAHKDLSHRHRLLASLRRPSVTELDVDPMHSRHAAVVRHDLSRGNE